MFLFTSSVYRGVMKAIKAKIKLAEQAYAEDIQGLQDDFDRDYAFLEESLETNKKTALDRWVKSVISF